MEGLKSLHKRDSMMLNMRTYINNMESRLARIEDENFCLKNSVQANIAERVLVLNPAGISSIRPDVTTIGSVIRKNDGNFVLSASAAGVATAELKFMDGHKPMLVSLNVHCIHEKSPELMFSISGDESENWKTVKAAEKLSVFYVPQQNRQEGWSLRFSVKPKDKILVEDYAFLAFSEIKAVWNSLETGTKVAQIV